MVRIFELQECYLDEDDPWKGILAAAAFAVRSTVHSTLQKFPGKLIFGRDMMLSINHEANWDLIRQKKQSKIDKNN